MLSSLKQRPDGERCFRSRAPVGVSNLSQELPKEVVSVLALLTPHSVLALPLILLAGGEVEKPGCTSSPSVPCAVCSPVVAQAGQGWLVKLGSLLKAWTSTECCRCELQQGPCDAKCFSSVPLSIVQGP